MLLNCIRMNASQPSVKEVTEFILLNRGTSEAFKDWTVQEIQLCLIHGSLHGLVAIYQSPEDNAIAGVVDFKLEPELKLMYVSNILATDKRALKAFVFKFKELYPDYELASRRKSKIKIYNTDKLCLKISKLH